MTTPSEGLNRGKSNENQIYFHLVGSEDLGGKRGIPKIAYG
jgi:hypothetical protein